MGKDEPVIFKSSLTDEYLQQCQKEVVKSHIKFNLIASPIMVFLGILAFAVLFLLGFNLLILSVVMVFAVMFAALYFPFSSAFVCYFLTTAKPKASWYEHMAYSDRYVCHYDAGLVKFDREIPYSNIMDITPYKPKKLWFEFYKPFTTAPLPGYSFYKDYAGFYHPSCHGELMYRIYLREPMTWENMPAKGKVKYVVVDMADIDKFKDIVRKGGGMK